MFLFAKEEQGTTSSWVFEFPKTKGADRLDEENVLVRQKWWSQQCVAKQNGLHVPVLHVYGPVLPSQRHLIPVTSSLCLLCFPVFSAEKKKALCLSSPDTDAIILTQTIPVFLFQHSMSYVRSGFQCQKSDMEGETASGFTISTLGLRQRRFWMGEMSPIQSHCVHTRWWLTAMICVFVSVKH